MQLGGQTIENFVLIKGNVPLSALFTLNEKNDVDWEKYGLCAYHCQKLAGQAMVGDVYHQLLPITDMTKFNLYWDELQAFVASDTFLDDSIELLNEAEYNVQKALIDNSGCHDCKGLKKKALKAKRDEIIANGITYNDEVFQIDAVSLANISQFASIADDSMAPICWLTKGNIEHTFDDADDFKLFCQAAILRVKEIYNVYNEKRTQLTNAGDDETLIALVDVDAGWPA